jgi:hypothetical protein
VSRKKSERSLFVLTHGHQTFKKIHVAGHCALFQKPSHPYPL